MVSVRCPGFALSLSSVLPLTQSHGISFSPLLLFHQEVLLCLLSLDSAQYHGVVSDCVAFLSPFATLTLRLSSYTHLLAFLCSVHFLFITFFGSAQKRFALMDK